jgi:cytochrome c-type biogenesis protein CcmF
VGNLSALTRSILGPTRTSGRPSPAMLVEAFARNRRLHGGLIAHLGVGVATIAITASSFQQQAEVTLHRDGQTTFAGYTIRYQGLTPKPEAQRMVLEAPVAVSRAGRSLGGMTPALNLYPAASEPIGSPAVRYGWLEDLYVSILGFDERGEQATFRLFLNPGVSWLWVGAVIMALGGLCALWPGRRRPVAAGLAVATPQLAEVS